MAEVQAQMFKEPEWLTFTDRLLDRLRGRMNLVQPPNERRNIVTAAINDLCSEGWPERLPQLSNLEVREIYLRQFLSYDPIEGLLSEPAVEDIMINATDVIFVHRTGEGLSRVDLRFTGTRELAIFVKKLIIFGGRLEVDPINDVELLDVRGRVNIVGSPFGPQITITRAKSNPLSMLHIIESGMLTSHLAAQLWIYVEGLAVRPANMVIAGVPGAGKTTLMNALLSFIPATDRVVVIEDTLELNTQVLENCSRLQSDRRVRMSGLVKNCLRMRPERILIGEVRGEEAQDMMTAINIGKYCLGTMHASSARETILRLQNWPMNVPEILVNLIDVFIILQRFRIGGKVLRSVGEVSESAGMEQKVVLLSPVWMYDREQGRLVESSPSSVFRDRLAQMAGVTSMQVIEETLRRSMVLDLMMGKPEMKQMGNMTTFCQRYIERPEEAVAELGSSMKDLDAAIADQTK